MKTDKDGQWGILGAAILALIAVAVAVALIATEAQASGPYTYLGEGIWEGASGGYYLRSESSERTPYNVRVRYFRNGCSYWRTETRYRNSSRNTWTPIKMGQRNFKAAAARGWKELFIEKQAATLENQDFLAAFRLLNRQGADRPQSAIYGDQPGGYARSPYSPGGQYANAITTQSVYGYPPQSAQYAGNRAQPAGLQALLDAAAAGRALEQAGETYRDFGAVTLELMAAAVDGQKEISKYERDLAIASLLTDIATQPERHSRDVVPQSQSHTRVVQPLIPSGPQTPNIGSELYDDFTPDRSDRGGLDTKQTLLAAQGIVTKRCTDCHNGTTAPKGWDLTDWAGLALDEKATVLKIVKEPTMPLDQIEDGQVVPLPSDEVRILEDATLIAAKTAAQR